MSIESLSFEDGSRQSNNQRSAQSTLSKAGHPLKIMTDNPYELAIELTLPGSIWIGTMQIQAITTISTHRYPIQCFVSILDKGTDQPRWQYACLVSCDEQFLGDIT